MRCSSITAALFDRECRGRRMVAHRGLFQDLVCTSCTTYNEEDVLHDHEQRAVPPFSVEFGKSKLAGILVAADEEGCVSVINTNVPKKDCESNVYRKIFHRNAIFDQAFSDGDSLLATASGDQTIRIWDMASGVPEYNHTLRGHKGSVKSVQFRPGSQCELVSSARDGSIILWDTRVSRTSDVGTLEIPPLHVTMSAHGGSSAGAGRAAAPGRGRETESQQSVTNVLFVDGHVLASAGAKDGAVKLWDLRKGFGAETPVLHSLLEREVRATGRPRGVSSLALDAGRGRLLASSTDHHMYIFDCADPERPPVTLSGHSNSSFYVKSCFSPDGRFVLSGSSDSEACIWDVQRPLLPPLRLKGHLGEVSDVAWCPTDMTRLATCSDDTTVRVWNVARGLDGEGGRRVPWCGQRTGRAEAEAGWAEAEAEAGGGESEMLACHETMLQSSSSSSPPSARPRSAGAQRTPQTVRLSLEEEEGECGGRGQGATRQIVWTEAAGAGGSATLTQAKLSHFFPRRQGGGGVQGERRAGSSHSKRRGGERGEDEAWPAAKSARRG